MGVHVALLRGINVGGSGKLPMVELKAAAEGLGFRNVSTYIQSGNLVFSSDDDRDTIASRLDAALEHKLGRAPGVFLRSPEELAAILADNPFSAMAENRVLVTFLRQAAGDSALHGFEAPDGEEAVVHGREIYVHYPIGSGRSRLKLPALKGGTARNIATVRKLAERAAALQLG